MHIYFDANCAKCVSIFAAIWWVALLCRGRQHWSLPLRLRRRYFNHFIKNFRNDSHFLEHAYCLCFNSNLCGLQQYPTCFCPTSENSHRKFVFLVRAWRQARRRYKTFFLFYSKILLFRAHRPFTKRILMHTVCVTPYLKFVKNIFARLCCKTLQFYFLNNFLFLFLFFSYRENKHI